MADLVVVIHLKGEDGLLRCANPVAVSDLLHADTQATLRAATPKPPPAPVAPMSPEERAEFERMVPEQYHDYAVEPSMGPLRDLVFMAHAAAPFSFVSPHTETYRLPLVSSISLSTVRLSLLLLLRQPRHDLSVSASSYSALVSCSTSAQ